MKNRYKVYIHKNLINGKVYIGQTHKTLQERSGLNGKNYKGCPRFYEDIEKYGWDNFDHKVLYDNLSCEEANKLERELIKQYKSLDSNYGYNVASGGGNKDIDEFKYQHEVNIGGATIIKKTKTINSQRKAMKEYEKKIEQLTVRLPQGSRDKINKYVKSNDMFTSVNEMIKSLIEIEIGQALE